MNRNFCALGLVALLSVAGTPALADVKAGVEAWSRGDYAVAVKEWRQPAINGDPDAQFNLGQAYKLGRGVPADLKLAEDWYRKASEKGHLQASDNLGLIMFQNGQRDQAMPLIRASAGRGEPRAQYVLGTALFNGDMLQKDWVRAYALMTRASASGLAPASASLAQMDRYIPLDQRQKGLALARDLEIEAARPPQLADATPPAVRPTQPSYPPIRTAEVPPSRPVYEPPAQSDPIEEVPTPRPRPRPMPPIKPQPVAQPRPEPVQVAAGGRWRVQLGAFGEQGGARALWQQISGRVPKLAGLQPYLVKAGAITRLQAGPLASKAAAEQVCASVKAAGQGCLAISS